MNATCHKSEVTDMSQTCHTCELVPSHTHKHVWHLWMRCVTRMNGICRTHDSRAQRHARSEVVSHIWSRQITHNESHKCLSHAKSNKSHIWRWCQLYEVARMTHLLNGRARTDVVSHTWMRQVALTYMHTNEYVWTRMKTYLHVCTRLPHLLKGRARLEVISQTWMRYIAHYKSHIWLTC